jgi:hypothetical protein
MRDRTNGTERNALGDYANRSRHVLTQTDSTLVGLKQAPVPQPLESQLMCFVIGPIGNALAEHGSPEREIYENSLHVMAEVIEPACAEYGFTPVRADSLARAGEITTQIFRRLRDDDIVIADLTDANPNVMYELGLRHTRNKLTIQIGEYGRLPFDISTIRTIQFSRSPVGLIKAREELIRVLKAGVSGDYDPVTATHVWNDAESPHDTATGSAQGEAATKADDNTDERYFVDILAEAEGPQEELAPALEAISACIVDLSALSERATDQIKRSDASGKGMRGRLRVITAYASDAVDVAGRLESAVNHYVSVLNATSAGIVVLIERMENDPETRSEGHTFGMASRRAAHIARETMTSLAGLTKSIESNASASRVLKEPSQRLTAALNRFATTTSLVDEWDRRLQALGIPVPPADWTLDLRENEPTEDHDSPSDETALDISIHVGNSSNT